MRSKRKEINKYKLLNLHYSHLINRRERQKEGDYRKADELKEKGNLMVKNMD